MSHAAICNLSSRKGFLTTDRFVLLTQKLFFATNIQDIPHMYLSDVNKRKTIEFFHMATLYSKAPIFRWEENQTTGL